MKRWIGLAVAVVLSLFFLLTPAVAESDPVPAAANRLSRSGALPPTAGVVHARPALHPEALINDGSFELGPPPASAWTEVTNGTCEWIDDWSSVWGVAAYDGTFDFWAGGYCGGAPTSSSVEQANIPVTATDNELHFWILSYRPDDDDSALDQAYVQVNGTTVWTYDLIQENDTMPNWVEQIVDLSAWAGQNVTLKFGANSAGDETGNIRFDFIQMEPGQGPPMHTVTSSVGTPSGTIAPPSQVVAHGATAAFTLTPDAGYAIEGVETTCPEGTRVGNVYTTGPITADCEVIAHFLPEAGPGPSVLEIPTLAPVGGALLGLALVGLGLGVLRRRRGA